MGLGLMWHRCQSFSLGTALQSRGATIGVCVGGQWGLHCTKLTWPPWQTACSGPQRNTLQRSWRCGAQLTGLIDRGNARKFTHWEADCTAARGPQWRSFAAEIAVIVQVLRRADQDAV